MTRFVASLEYQGSRYKGWQKQQGKRTVAGYVEQALSQVANHPVAIIAAGRTDKGVHASQQIIHFDSDNPRLPRQWHAGANNYLPDDIKLHWVQETDIDFHARFSAHSRRYVYLIYNHSSAQALLHPYYNWEYQALNVNAMHQAATSLIGWNDFSAFRSTDCQSPNSNRRVDFASVSQHQHWIRFDIQANAFLHKMVRMLVAELITIGKNQQPPERIQQLIQQGTRRQKPAAIPAGLFLSEVGYPKQWQLPIQATEDQWIYQLGTGIGLN